MKVSGVYPVLPTPFDASGAIDDSGMDAIVDFVVDCGVDGAVFPGLASEYDMLSLDERIGLITRIATRIDGRIGFIIGGSSPDIEESLALIRAGKAAGAAGAMVMTPGALAGDNDALAAHYRTLGEIGLPLMLQNAPRPMGAGLSAEDVIAVVAAAPDHLLGVFGGAGGRYITDELARGAIGTMPAAELPEAHVALMAAHLAGDGDAVRTHYERMLPLLMMQAVFRWRLTKEVLRRRGLIADAFTRAPGPELDEGDQRELDRILARIDDWTGIGVVQG